MNALGMQDRLDVLELRFYAEERRYRYDVLRKTWAAPALSEKTNVFSKVGTGARDVVFTMRHSEDIAPGRILRWRRGDLTEYCFVTAVTPLDRNYDSVHAARVQLCDCLAEANHDPQGARFPAILTEKYVGHEQLDPLALNVTTYVLVCQKEITLKRGSIVEVDGTPYHVLLGHFLDAYKNEYEIQRTEDL